MCIQRIINEIKEGMIEIRGGVFEMGDINKCYNPLFKPSINSTLVELDTFSLSDHVVTREEWAVVNRLTCRQGEEKLPQTRVSWHEAYDFINKLNELTRGRFRLPTEAEWEYAARGGEFRERNETFAGGIVLDTVGWYSGNSSFKLHPIKTMKSNRLGLYDMSGNVWEWCSDVYLRDYPVKFSEISFFDRLFGESPKQIAINNPAGGVSGTQRVLRGGAYNEDDYKCWFFYRNKMTSTDKSKNVGFRLAYK